MCRLGCLLAAMLVVQTATAQPFETEPNNTLETANALPVDITISGQVHPVTDAYDFFKGLMPASGGLRIVVHITNTGTETGAVLMNAYDSRKLNTSLVQRYVGQFNAVNPGQTIRDTVYIPGLTQDSLFFRLWAQGGSNAQFSYILTYSVLHAWPDDAEPNNDWNSATPVAANQPVQGNTGYRKQGVADSDDFFRGWHAKHGTVKMYVEATNRHSEVSQMLMALYDGRKAGGLMQLKYMGPTNIAPGQTVLDSIVVQGRAPDSIYLRLQSPFAFNYRVWFATADTVAENTEPNNNFAQSVPIAFDSVVRGNIFYQYRASFDDQDYYKIEVPKGGTLRLIMEGTRTNSVNAGYLFAMGYDETGEAFNAPFQRFIGGNTNVGFGQTVKDTIVVNCFKKGMFYLRITSSGSFSYAFSLQYTNQTPVAQMQYEQMGREVAFRPVLTRAQSYLWSFGDNTTSTLPYPLKTYSPGFYKARLIANNDVCNYKDTALAEITIKGIDSYTPGQAGSGGNVAMQILGGGLDTTVQVSLIKGSTMLVPFAKHTNNKGNILTAEFDLHAADTGLYDVQISVPGIDVINYPKGFAVDTLIYPYAWSAIQGPGLWRTNRPNRFNLLVGNTGNINAAGVVVGLVWSKNTQLQWEWPLYKPAFTGVDSLVDESTIYTVDRSEFQYIFDSLITVTPIDTFQGKPFDGYITYLMVPYIPPGQVVSYPFFATAIVPGDVTFMSFTHRPNMFGSPATGVYTDYTNAVGTELLDAADMAAGKTNNPLFISFTKTAKVGEKHMRSAATAAGKKFWGWYDGYETNDAAILQDWLKETEANNEYALQQFLQAAGDLTLKAAVNRAKKIQERLNFANQYMARRPDMSPEMFERYVDYINRTGKQIAGIDVSRLTKLKKLYDEAKYGAKLSKKLDLLQEIINNTPALQAQRKYLEKHLDDNFFHDKLDRKPTRAVTSIDPNALYGPVGFGAAGYLNHSNTQHFMVAFENMSTATAAAQVVRIMDTIDTRVFDMASFSFGPFSIGSRQYRVPPGRKTLAMQVVLSPTMQVRVNAIAHTSTGVVEWQFTAIDPATGGFPQLEGFLPPNVNMPEGEGSVSYFIAPKPGLPSGTVLQSRATIVFDDNEPIATNIWSNSLDTQAPQSQLQAQAATGDSTVHLQLSGTDAGAGLYAYAVYISDNNGPWLRLGSTTADTLRFEGEYDHTYRFYVTATDSVGNEETKPTIPEATLTLTRPLPVHFIRFEGQTLHQANLLQWATATEQHNLGFTLEYSTNGTAFVPIAWVPSQAANGNSSTLLQYAYTHNNPPPKAWYRLVQQDVDGKKQYSTTILLRQPVHVASLTLFPNPATTQLTLLGQGISQVRVFDAKGTVLQANQYRQVHQVSLPLQYPPGLYWVDVWGNGWKETRKLIIE